jgi:hypothetical protein
MPIAFGLTLTDYRDFVNVGQFLVLPSTIAQLASDGMTYVPAWSSEKISSGRLPRHTLINESIDSRLPGDQGASYQVEDNWLTS